MQTDISIIIPTLNEQGSIKELFRRIDFILQDIRWEVIFVDDNSPDNTLKIIKEMAAKDNRVKYIHRVGRSGLSSAVIEGIELSQSRLYGVMEGD